MYRILSALLASSLLIFASAASCKAESSAFVFMREDVSRPSAFFPGTAVRIRIIQSPVVRLHHALLTKSSSGLISQREYLSPYGILTVVDTPVRSENVLSRSSYTGNIARQVANPAGGITHNGATWALATESDRDVLYVQFIDSLVFVSLPKGIPPNVAGALAEAIR